MKKVIFPTNFPNIKEEFLDKDKIIEFKGLLTEYKRFYETYLEIEKILYESLGVKNIDDNSSFKKNICKNIKNAIIFNKSKNSSNSTQTIENIDIDNLLINENLFYKAKSYSISEKDEKEENKIISQNIFKMYINYKLDLNNFDLGEVKKIHKDIFSFNNKYLSGKIRKLNNKVSDIEFPNFEFVPKYMDKFIFYFNNRDNEYESIVKSAMIHVLFVAIHPFKDGNGRTARFLADKYLSAKYKVPLFLSESISSDGNNKYHACLRHFFINLDPMSFINYYIEIGINQLNKNIDYFKKFVKDLMSIKEKLNKLDIKEEYKIKLSVEFSYNNLFSISRIKNMLEVSQVTARTVFDKLKNSKLSKKYKIINNQNVFEFII